MANIIISYRRSESAAIAGRIRDRLAQYYGADAIFMDIDNIPLGADFRQEIQKEVTKNDILLALIGPRWIGAKKGGTSRISEEKDPIRIEIETALSQGIPLIPVLVGGAAMPKSSALPDSLQKLCLLNAAEVDDGRDFHQHVDRLIRAMDRLLTDSKLGALEQKSESHPIRDVAGPLPLRGDAAARTGQLADRRHIQTDTASKNSAAFTAFVCSQTIVYARVASFAVMAAWIAIGAADVGHEAQAPAMIEHRSFIAIPAALAIFAATYLSLAQRYWQTFLTMLCIVHAGVIFSAAWVSYKTETPFDLEKWALALAVTIGIGVLIPVRLLNAVVISVFAIGLIYLFLFLTNELLLSTAWLQGLNAVALFVFCAVAYFREQLLWALFQSDESTKSRPHRSD
jgi:hypothetical protein